MCATTICAERNEVDVVWWRIIHPVSMVVGKSTFMNRSHFFIYTALGTRLVRNHISLNFKFKMMLKNKAKLTGFYYNILGSLELVYHIVSPISDN